MTTTALGAWRGLRPRQWVKNALVLAAPLAAGRFLEPTILVSTLLAVVCFCAVASAVYLINDVRDVAEDRLHPTKRLRPIAAGELAVPTAIAMAVVLALAALSGTFLARPAGHHSRRRGRGRCGDDRGTPRRDLGARRNARCDVGTATRAATDLPQAADLG